MDCIVQGVAESQTRLSDLHFTSLNSVSRKNIAPLGFHFQLLPTSSHSTLDLLLPSPLLLRLYPVSSFTPSACRKVSSRDYVSEGDALQHPVLTLSSCLYDSLCDRPDGSGLPEFRANSPPGRQGDATGRVGVVGNKTKLTFSREARSSLQSLRA